jgi:hypothetical protein
VAEPLSGHPALHSHSSHSGKWSLSPCFIFHGSGRNLVLGKIKMFLCLNKQNAMNTFGEVEDSLHEREWTAS